MEKDRSGTRPAFPGLHLVIAVAVVARFLHGLIPNPTLARGVSEVFLAVLLGLYVRNVIRFSKRFEPGVKFGLQRILRLGIILLGLRLSLQDVVSTGLTSLLLILACMALALIAGAAGGRFLKIPGRLAALIGVGTAICGNTAIVAVAPVIEAQDEDISFAVATITFFGTLAVVLYPIIGVLLGLSDRTFGLWAGTAVNDTSQVVATGAAFSERAARHRHSGQADAQYPDGPRDRADRPGLRPRTEDATESHRLPNSPSARSCRGSSSASC